MNNKMLCLLVIIINIIMMFLLVDKQNKIIKHLYQLQQLQEQKNLLLEQNKELMLELHKEKQLSMIESQAKNNLQMEKIKLNDIQRLPEKVA
ncbi:cell division protein FtsL [Candidatus Dependentiae bacterium]|nr:cell division protein FtsL [Candidatus Dependentiae bacterium]